MLASFETTTDPFEIRQVSETGRLTNAVIRYLASKLDTQILIVNVSQLTVSINETDVFAFENTSNVLFN